MTGQKRIDRHDQRLRASGKPFIECRECGRPLRFMGTHLSRVHGMTAREYLIKHQLPLGTVLAAPDYADHMREVLRNDPERMQKMASYFSSEENRVRLAATDWEGIGRKISESKQARLTDEERRIMRDRVLRLDKQLSRQKLIENNFRDGRTLLRCCKQCGREYVTKQSCNHYFCCSEHYHQWNRAHRPKDDAPSFSPGAVIVRNSQIRAGKQRRTRTCEACGIRFVRGKHQTQQRFCSNECANSLRERNSLGQYS